MLMVPKTRPMLTKEDLVEKIYEAHKRPGVQLDLSPLFVVGIRGYYKRTMGDPGKNDAGIYDDALFVVAPWAYAAFNGNTDPSRVIPGVAVLKPGIWKSYRLELHKNKYRALCQRAGSVVVVRTDDQGRQYEENGFFGINIHRGGTSSTGSEGCQTIHPSQWDAFIGLVIDQAKRLYGDKWNKTVIPYVLLEN